MYLLMDYHRFVLVFFLFFCFIFGFVGWTSLDVVRIWLRSRIGIIHTTVDDPQAALFGAFAFGSLNLPNTLTVSESKVTSVTTSLSVSRYVSI